jgi:hypothetical protein
MKSARIPRLHFHSTQSGELSEHEPGIERLRPEQVEILRVAMTELKRQAGASGQ